MRSLKVHSLFFIVIMGSCFSSMAKDSVLKAPGIYSSDPCVKAFSRLFHPFFREPIQKISPFEKHTIEDIQKYMAEKLGRPLAESTKNPKAKYIILKGSLEQEIDKLFSTPIKEKVLLENPFGVFNVFKIILEGSPDPIFIIANVNGESRLVQISSLLKHSGVKDLNIRLINKKSDYISLYKRTFESISERPDLVVFGFANTAVEGVVESLSFKNMDSIKKLNKVYGEEKWVKPIYPEHELKNMGVQVLKLPNDKVIWFIDNEYGDRAGWIMQALGEVAKADVLFLGTAGSLTTKFNVGDLVRPTAHWQESLKTPVEIPQNSLQQKSFVTFDGLHGHVDSPSLETQRWLDKATDDGIEIIEVELKYVLEQQKKAKVPVQLHPYFIISDLLVGNQTKDYTKWGEEHRQMVKGQITELVKKYIGIDEDIFQGKQAEYFIQKFITEEIASSENIK